MGRFFALVWRANALVILAARLAGLALVTLLLVQLGREFLEPRRLQGVVNLADEEIESETFHFGGFESIPGSHFLSAPLYTQQGYPLGSISKSSQSSRNYLFYDPATGAAHWLLPDNEGLVEWRYEFPSSRYERDREPVRGVLWQVIASDTTPIANSPRTTFPSSSSPVLPAARCASSSPASNGFTARRSSRQTGCL